MAISYILADVNNFMQIFEPALCDIDKRAQVLDTWSVFTSQNIFIHRMTILVEFSPCLVRSFIAFVRYF